MLSAKMEDYLKAIYELTETEGEPVATSSIAEHLGVTPPTVTSMMEKLAERGLVSREKYRGVELTREGKTVALEVIRHHRLLETYLVEQLDYDWADVHEEADRLEHHISEEFERRVAEQLDNPAVDPHGDPIPNDALEPLDQLDEETLADHTEGERVVVHRVSDRNREELSYLQRVGVTPGAQLQIAEVSPIGVVTVSVADGQEVALSEDVAESIRVESVEQPAQ